MAYQHILMVIKPNYIIIGASGRNTGKTEFACKLIEEHSKINRIIGVKVTSIDKNEGRCPRGSKSCGVCDSLEGKYTITEESNPATSKDTSRMLQAGAEKVLWLKVDSRYIKTGFEALDKQIPGNAFAICESNSLRTVAEPGLFIVIRNKNDKSIKRSCANVIDYANKIITFDNMSWDFQPGRVLIKNGEWIIREKATAIILAGGKSSRMQGMDKSLLPVDGQPLITHVASQLSQHFDEIIIGSNNPEKYSFTGLRIVPDLIPGYGPLMGILSCVKASRHEVNFVTACDIPTMNIKLIKNMINLSVDNDIVMPVSENDKHEPLYAVYKKSIIKPAETILANNGRRIIELLNQVKSKLIGFSDNKWYQNLNSREDYFNYIKERNINKCGESDGKQ